MANRLQFETSPYLLQHAHNPVDWRPWGDEAFAAARAEDKPILLSVGYSACHWCHVMERESFENPQIAALMNQWFVNVKVDREERPDIDQIYMTAVQAMTGQGGWPMTVFLTPTGEPFYGGTYYPPVDTRGMPGFPRILAAVADAYRTRRDEVARSAAAIAQHLRDHQPVGTDITPLDPAVRDAAVASIAPAFDPRHGGFGNAPKFPQPMMLEFLLRVAAATGDTRALHMAELTLHKMADGGMYDHLGGGFHRYSTDSEWLVPHFEKMLYDNAQLARVYLAAYQLTGAPFYRRVAEETLDYVAREMTAPDGGFYSTQDADSEGDEGKFFVWTPEEIRAALGERDAALVGHYYGVTEHGNFEGKNILHVRQSLDEAARERKATVAELTAALERGRAILFAVRERRVKPHRDDKVITAWNGMMLRAFAEAAAVLDRPDYRIIAERNAAFVLGTLERDGRLLRVFTDGRAHVLGYLEDYANLCDGLIALYEATFHRRWLANADRLAAEMLARFWDETIGGFYDTADDHESLIVRPRDVFDNATPAGNSVAVDALLRLALLTGNTAYRERATTVLGRFAAYLQRAPSAFGRLLCAFDFAVSHPKEIAIIGDPDGADTAALVQTARRPYLPNKVIAAAPDGDPTLPLLADKTRRDGRATAYVCHHYVCQAPTTDPAILAQLLRA